MGEHAWECVHGSVCMGVHARECVNRSVCMYMCTQVYVCVGK